MTTDTNTQALSPGDNARAHAGRICGATAPNLACKSTQKRLAEQWGYGPAPVSAAIWQWLTSDGGSICERWQAIVARWDGSDGRAGLEEAAVAAMLAHGSCGMSTMPEPWGRDDLMALAAVRYCLGRMSYIVGDCCDWLRAVWPDLSPSIRKTIARDIDEAFARDDEARERGDQYKPLGMDMDRAQWTAVRVMWQPTKSEEA